MPDNVIETWDAPLDPGDYLHVATRAWWTASLERPDGKGWFAYLAEQLLTEWVPQDPAADWLWDRRMTGDRRWLVGSEEEARALGLETTSGWPTGRWQAAYGDYFAVDEARQPSPREGSWSLPTVEFFAELPTQPDALLARLVSDSPPTRLGRNGPMTYARKMLCTGRVPAVLREATFAALQRVPGVVTGTEQNADHETGVAFVYEDAAHRAEIIVNSDGGQFIGERQTVKGGPNTQWPCVRVSGRLSTCGNMRLPTPLTDLTQGHWAEHRSTAEHGDLDDVRAGRYRSCAWRAANQLRARLSWSAERSVEAVLLCGGPDSRVPPAASGPEAGASERLIP